MKKLFALILALCMMVSVVAMAEETFDLDAYVAASSEVYNAQLGEFYSIYADAREENENVSLRYAQMALAEAKLLESAVLLPTSSQGGNYAISRVVTRTNTSVLWGNDSYRYYPRLIATELIKAEDSAALKALWLEVQGTGTYMEKARAYMEEHGYTLKSDYSIGYSSDPKTWDVLATSRAADSEAIVNTYDGLLEYDVENIQQPALAESYTVSEDGLTYTFVIRQGAVWVDSQGRKVADVKADDFVAGLQHMMDAMGGLEYLIDGVILNAGQYMAGEVDFDQVGVTAVDDATLVYTLAKPTPYFTTMMGYGVFAPMSRSYYESKGGKFGADFDASAENYNYGKTPNDIAYCGPYLVTNSTAENTIVFSANESYWNKDAVNVKTITWKFNPGDDPTKPYNDTMSGVLDGCGLNASSLQLAREQGVFEPYSYTSATDATSFCGFMNMNRTLFANVNDPTTVVSPQTAEDAQRTAAAMNNVHFRRAVMFAIDRAAYNAQTVGEELKLTSLRNTYTPGMFVQTSEDVTVTINGEEKTYPAGTWYGRFMQDQIDADGVKMTVYMDNAENGSDGFDGWYNVENAKEELAVAVAALAEQGVVVDAEHPIYIDVPYPSNSEVYTNKETALKKSVEAALDGAVIVNLVECKDYAEWYYAGYYTDYGYEANYDIYDLSGWGPDYGDPSTYLDTMLPDFAGYMTKCLGIF